MTQANTTAYNPIQFLSEPAFRVGFFDASNGRFRSDSFMTSEGGRGQYETFAYEAGWQFGRLSPTLDVETFSKLMADGSILCHRIP